MIHDLGFGGVIWWIQIIYFLKFLKQLFQPLFVRIIDPNNIIFIKKTLLIFFVNFIQVWVGELLGSIHRVNLDLW